MGQWALAVQAQASERKDELAPLMKFAPFPEITGRPGSMYDAMGGGNGFVIGSNVPDEAVEFLEYYTRAENLQRLYNAFPAVPTVPEVEIASTSLKMVRDYVQQAGSYSLYPDQMFPQDIGIALNETSARIMLGELTPEEGCQYLNQVWQDYRDR
jgi:raffinose/stachyose/melibiose transport system substrate-binding protein